MLRALPPSAPFLACFYQEPPFFGLRDFVSPLSRVLCFSCAPLYTMIVLVRQLFCDSCMSEEMFSLDEVERLENRLGAQLVDPRHPSTA